MVLVKAKVVDSTHLELSKPLSEPRGTIILVSVADTDEKDAERQQWCTTSATSLSAAYGDGEPDYPTSLIQEGNPDYGE